MPLLSLEYTHFTPPSIPFLAEWSFEGLYMCICVCERKKGVRSVIRILREHEYISIAHTERKSAEKKRWMMCGKQCIHRSRGAKYRSDVKIKRQVQDFYSEQTKRAWDDKMTAASAAVDCKQQQALHTFAWLFSREGENSCLFFLPECVCKSERQTES